MQFIQSENYPKMIVHTKFGGFVWSKSIFAGQNIRIEWNGYNMVNRLNDQVYRGYLIK